MRSLAGIHTNTKGMPKNENFSVLNRMQNQRFERYMIVQFCFVSFCQYFVELFLFFL